MMAQEIIDARRSAKGVAEYGPADRFDALLLLVTKLYAMKGLCVSDDMRPELEAMVRGIEGKVAYRYGRTTLAEISLAWEEGICGGFTKDTRITMANLLSWLSLYHDLDARKEALYTINLERSRVRPEKALPPADSERLNEEAARRGARETWEHYKANGSLPADLLGGYAGVIVNYLESIGKLRATEATRQKAEEMYEEKRRTGQVGHFLGGRQGGIKKELLGLYYESLVKRGVELRV